MGVDAGPQRAGVGQGAPRGLQRLLTVEQRGLGAVRRVLIGDERAVGLVGHRHPDHHRPGIHLLGIPVVARIEQVILSLVLVVDNLRRPQRIVAEVVLRGIEHGKALLFRYVFPAGQILAAVADEAGGAVGAVQIIPAVFRAAGVSDLDHLGVGHRGNQVVAVKQALVERAVLLDLIVKGQRDFGVPARCEQDNGRCHRREQSCNPPFFHGAPAFLPLFIPASQPVSGGAFLRFSPVNGHAMPGIATKCGNSMKEALAGRHTARILYLTNAKPCFSQFLRVNLSLRYVLA